MDGGVGSRGGVVSKSKESLKSKLDGNQLDLSLNGLDVVPIKELVCTDLGNIIVALNPLLNSDLKSIAHRVFMMRKSRGGRLASGW